MKQRKPIIHARDHLPGGADPLPGLGVPGADDATRDTFGDAPPGTYSHWWRFRDFPWSTEDLANFSHCTEDLGNYRTVAEGDAADGPRWLCIQHGPLGEDETTGGYPGPSAGTYAMRREWTPAIPGFPNAWSVTAANLYDIPVGKTHQVSVAGWFKFTDLGDGPYNVFNWGAQAYDHLVLNPNGSLTITREGVAHTTAAGVIKAGKWHYIVYVIGLGRMRLYVDPAAPTSTPAEPVSPAIGADFPFDGPMAMETWGLEKGDYTAAELAAKLTGAGFRSIAVQLNAEPGAGRDHADYITKLAADTATLQAAGLQVIGWGEVDSNTAADLAGTGVTGWLPQIEGPGQRDAVISALGAGVGGSLPRAVVTTYGGLDTPADVAALAAAGITAAAVESYADDGHNNVSVMLGAGVNYGFDLGKLIPVLGTYRNEGPTDYIGFDASIVPNYGTYNVPQTSDAAWSDFGAINGSTATGTNLWVDPVIDAPDPIIEHPTDSDAMGFAIGNSNYPEHIPDVGAMQGDISEVFVCGWMLPGDQVRSLYLSGSYGDTGKVPPQEVIPAGGIAPPQIASGGDGQVLRTLSGATAWVDPFTYHGAWDPDTDYDTGAVVVYGDLVYLAVRPTSSPPTGWE